MVYNDKSGMILLRQTKLMQVPYIFLKEHLCSCNKKGSDLRVRQEKESAVDSRVMKIIKMPNFSRIMQDLCQMS